jgi:hypothetical protein
VLRRRVPLPLFALVFGTYAYFYQAGGWNQNSRFDLTRAVVEQGTLAIDAFQENTGDKAQRDGHWYTDKAPGLSLLAVPAYALVHAVRAGAVVAGSYVGTVFAVALPSALAAVQLFALGRLIGLSAAWSAALTLAYALGTLALPYSTIFYGHQLSAALGLSAFALVWRRRAPLLAGLLLGLAVAVDYTSVILVIAVMGYAVAKLGARGVLWLIAGGAPIALALGAYHAAAFGHPLALPYEFVLQEHRRMGWFMGIAAPDPRVMGALLVGRYRGLFFGSPWLVAGIPGLVVLARRGFRAEAITCGGIVLAYLLLNAGLVDWHGGWAMGPRYLIPAIPFLAVGAMGLVLAWPAENSRAAHAGFGGGRGRGRFLRLDVDGHRRPSRRAPHDRAAVHPVRDPLVLARPGRAQQPRDRRGRGERRARGLEPRPPGGARPPALARASGRLDGADRMVAGPRGAGGGRSAPLARYFFFRRSGFSPPSPSVQAGGSLAGNDS